MFRLTFDRKNRRTINQTQSDEYVLPFETRETSILYRREDRTSWKTATGTAMSVPDTDRVVHTIELTDLNADFGYEFRVLEQAQVVYTTFKDNPSQSIVIHFHTGKPLPTYSEYFRSYTSTIQKFKTFPSTLNRTIRFAQITDTHGRVGNEQMFEHIAENDIDCMIHSGDMASGNGGYSTAGTWYIFFDCLQKAVDKEGYIIPLLANIGNHEAWRGSGGVEWVPQIESGIKPNFKTHERGDTEWYYCFFPSFPGLTGYGVIQFGDYAGAWQLDPGISTLVGEEQADWLADTLEEKKTIPHKFLSFHYCPFTGGRRLLVHMFNRTREVWCPIYEPYQPLVLNGHEHIWSKTEPVLGGAYDIDEAYIDPQGVVYIGSGPAQTNTSATHGRNPNTTWWLADSKTTEWRKYDFENREPHPTDGTSFTPEEVCNWWLIELESYNKRVMTAYDGNKDIIHTFEQTVDPYTTN